MSCAETQHLLQTSPSSPSPSSWLCPICSDQVPEVRNSLRVSCDESITSLKAIILRDSPNSRCAPQLWHAGAILTIVVTSHYMKMTLLDLCDLGVCPLPACSNELIDCHKRVVDYPMIGASFTFMARVLTLVTVAASSPDPNSASTDN